MLFVTMRLPISERLVTPSADNLLAKSHRTASLDPRPPSSLPSAPPANRPPIP